MAGRLVLHGLRSGMGRNSGHSQTSVNSAHAFSKTALYLMGHARLLAKMRVHEIPPAIFFTMVSCLISHGP